MKRNIRPLQYLYVRATKFLEYAHILCMHYSTVIYATGSRGKNINKPVTRHQSKAGFALTPCLLARFTR